MLDRKTLIDTINKMAALGQSFVFIVDYKGNFGKIFPISENTTDSIQYSIEQKSTIAVPPFDWQIEPISYPIYERKFQYVRNQIQEGNSFLVNLTQPSIVKTNLTPEAIFHYSSARYKVWLKNQFIALSPETFVRIQNGRISAYPMKGTIDATIENAEEIILNDLKEKAEHATIVDLIRNDLSMVATDVTVKRYRYIERIKTNQTELLQVSSEITGKLPEDYQNQLGHIIFKLLPAGSISGAPKPKTMQIIDAIEGYDRGFYTGIFGIFDGLHFDSAVLIRYIELTEKNLIFKSGGGITSKSNCIDEYIELIQKAYLPIQ